ncbi:hypothetical protein HPB51_007801 [Rhipicephalus microplus]|uniref:Uncharacterized protein n=1 Tax=Rhipicephalus microplus TaxID=6941 RepID=A0A9J6EZ58_RHIMP|nr:hypothetical protein HPB51_007801 [Rhipicephalus microplus]
MMAGVFDLELHDAENDKNDESSDDAIEVDEQVGGTWYRTAVVVTACVVRRLRSLPLLWARSTRGLHTVAAHSHRMAGRPAARGDCSISPVQPHSENLTLGGTPVVVVRAGVVYSLPLTPTRCASAPFILTRASAASVKVLGFTAAGARLARKRRNCWSDSQVCGLSSRTAVRSSASPHALLLLQAFRPRRGVDRSSAKVALLHFA